MDEAFISILPDSKCPYESVIFYDREKNYYVYTSKVGTKWMIIGRSNANVVYKIIMGSYDHLELSLHYSVYLDPKRIEKIKKLMYPTKSKKKIKANLRAMISLLKH